jgi:hypothetical protein
MRGTCTLRPPSVTAATAAAPLASVSEAYVASQYASASSIAFTSAAFDVVFSKLFPAFGFFSPLASAHHR